MKGGGLKDSREGALCDSGSLAGSHRAATPTTTEVWHCLISLSKASTAGFPGRSREIQLQIATLSNLMTLRQEGWPGVAPG